MTGARVARLARAGAVVGALALGAHARAATAEDGQAVSDACLAKAITTYDIVACQKATLAIVERELNTVYKQAVASLPDDQLVAAERLWVSFRQIDCDVFYGEQTGTIASIQGGGCMIGHARNRIADLKAIITP